MKRYLRPFAVDNSRQVGESMKEFARYEIELLSKDGHEPTRAFFVYYKLRGNGKYKFKKMTFWEPSTKTWSDSKRHIET